MVFAPNAELLGLASAKANCVASSEVCTKSYRLDASAFLNRDTCIPDLPTNSQQVLSEFADVFTVYIQTPIMYYVNPFANSRPYFTTSELGEYQRGTPAHVSLLTDSRLSEWEIARNTVVLSRSGRVGEAYWVDKKLSGALVGDSFRVVPRLPGDAYYIYALLASTYARNYVSGVTYGSVVGHASVDQVRSLPVPAIAGLLRVRIGELVQQAVQAREVAYDLLDIAEAEFLQANNLTEIQIPRPPVFDPLGQPQCFAVSVNIVSAAKNDGSEHRLDAHFYNLTAQKAVANIRECKEIKTVGELTHEVRMGPRFKRNYVESDHGVPFLSGKNIVQIRPTDLKYLSNLQMADMQELVIKQGWILVTCSGTIGRTCFVWNNYEDYAASQHILRIIPDATKIDPGYLYAFLSSQYGYEQIRRYRYGSVIDEVSDKQIEKVLVPLPSRTEQTAIGDKVRKAYEKRAEAIRLEDEAQAILMKEFTKAPGAKGV